MSAVSLRAPVGARLRAKLGLEPLLVHASLAIATIALNGWPVYATELVSGWLATRAR